MPVTAQQSAPALGNMTSTAPLIHQKNRKGTESSGAAPGFSKNSDPLKEDLWLALCFPYLSIDVIKQDLPIDDNIDASIELSKGGWVIYQASRQAQQQGIQAGMTLSEANTLVQGLRSYPRARCQEQHRLEYLAECMIQFSPSVCLEFPNTLLLEIRPSLGLFGGHRSLKTRINRELKKADHVFQSAMAPTPSAACVLARSIPKTFIEGKASIRSALGDVAIGLLGLDAKLYKRLRSTGLETLRDLWRLPKKDLARRYGKPLVYRLDQLLGEHPDPRPVYKPPLKFSRTLALDYATDDLAHLNQALVHLLEKFITHLRRVDRGTNAFRVDFLPEQGESKVGIDIGVREITRDLDYLKKLCAEKLNQIDFTQTVTALELSSKHIYPFAAETRSLFSTEDSSKLPWQQSEDIIAARLSGKKLNKLYAIAEHRPEYAWSEAVDPAINALCTQNPRPLWLLNKPKPLSTRHDGLWFKGQASIIKGPERIEAGWWDGNDLRRDYYIACNSKGSRLWIFQNLKDTKWYLHGLFG